jgi:hypothetical protein
VANTYRTADAGNQDRADLTLLLEALNRDTHPQSSKAPGIPTGSLPGTFIDGFVGTMGFLPGFPNQERKTR